jgi:hypothetical protein
MCDLRKRREKDPIGGSGMPTHDWWWHLMNDPMKDNPWSLVALAVFVGAFAGLTWLSTRPRNTAPPVKNRNQE